MSSQNTCVFCQIIMGKTPAVDYTDHGVIVGFKPLAPVVEGHRLFVPKLHVPNAASANEIAGQTFAAAAAHGSRVGEQFNLITNNGPDATQSVFHLHVHYIPRQKNDGLALPWFSGKVSKKH